MTKSTSVSKGFWVVGILGLIWNCMGAFQFFLEYNYWTNPESRSALPKNLDPFYDTTPAWLYIIFAVSVLTGLMGCIGLLMRKSWAVWLFLISLITVVLQMTYTLVGTELIKIMGPTHAIMPTVVMLIALGLFLYSKQSARKGWLA